ncbi:MAG: XdhC family protein [Chloracidobacterium sp.]
MLELDTLLAAIQRFTQPARRLALATVVRVTGSAYRRPGARMLISETGETVGQISGGCLEQDLVEKAQAVLMAGKPQLVTYDTRDASADLTWGVGLGCASETLIYIEPFHPNAWYHPLDLLAVARASGEDAALALVFRAEGKFAGRQGFRLLHTDRTPVATGGTGEAADWPRQLHLDLQTCLAERRSRQMTYGTEDGCLEAFIEFVPRPIQLAILGAGDDAIPLARLADQLGWEVTIMDWRPALATPERFPTARAIIVVPQVDDLPLDANHCVVVMTHHYPSDKAIARRLAQVQPRYVGLLGPRRRTERLLDELAAEGTPVAESVAGHWHFPVGLDIGAETPMEIALSIVAEILAVTNHRAGEFLRHRAAPIHEPLPSS